MNHSEIIETIFKTLQLCIPFFRVTWIICIILGIMLLALAYFIKNSTNRKMPWIVGGIGIIMIVNSGVQLLSTML